MGKLSPAALLNKLDPICSRLPETVRLDQAGHASFLVRKKPYAYFLNNHHGDGIMGIACKALPGDNQRLIDSDSDRFYMPAYVGPRGWVALRLDTAKIDWEEVSELILGSYLLIAPKTLAKQVNPD
jgi:phosphoribosylglycinamide formyltransferase-1